MSTLHLLIPRVFLGAKRRKRPLMTLLLASLCALPLCVSAAPSANTAQPISIWSTIEAPPAEGSAFANRLAHHRAEQHRPGFAADGSDHPIALPAQPSHFLASNYDALFQGDWSLEHQDITLSVDPFTATLSGEVTATVAFHKDGLKDILFRLGVLDGVDVRDADGNALTHKYSTYFNQLGQVLIALPKPSKKGTKWTVRVKYERKLDCKQKTTALKFCSFDNEIWSVTFYRYYLAHGGAYHSPFTSKLHVITPKDRRAAAPGIPSGPDTLPNGNLVWHFDQKERTSNAGFSIAKYTVLGDTDPASKVVAGDPYVRMYTLANYGASAKPLVEVARSIIDYFGKRFTKFPWAGINIIQAANNFGGGYAPLSGTFMYKNVFGAKVNGQGYIGFSELLAHELAHQWWGNLNRPLGSGDVSLSESLAEFSSCYYTEKTLKSRNQLIQDNLSYTYTVAAGQDRPMQATNVYGSAKYVQIIYHKGAVVFDMLRHELGDELMFKALSAYATDYNRDYARVKDLQVSIEKATGRDLGWFFEQWWQRKGSIRAEFSGRVDVKDGGGWTVKLRVKQLTEKPFRFKLPIRVTYADGTFEDRDEDVIPVGDDGLTIVAFDVTKPVRGVRPDRSRKLLRRFEILTPGDVNLDGLVDGMDLMETAFRTNRAIVWNNNFYPNALWDELFDSKQSYRIDGEDMTLVVENAGTQSVQF